MMCIYSCLNIILCTQRAPVCEHEIESSSLSWTLQWWLLG